MNKKIIKVLQVTGAMNRGGAEVMLMDIYRNISRDVHFDFLVNYKLKEGILKGDFDDEIIEKGATIKHIATQWDLGPYNYLKAFKRIIKDLGKPDIVHIHLNAKSGIIALAANKSGIKKIIAHSHANLKFRGSLQSMLFSKIELHFQKFLISRYATNFWGCSQEANNSLFYKNLQTKEKYAIINNAVDVKSFHSISQSVLNNIKETYLINKDTIVIGNIGRIVRHKNVLFIIEILKELKRKKIDFKFVFAGKPDDELYLNEIFDKTKEFNIEQNIKYLGSRDDVAAIVNTFDVFIGPALKEGFGLVAVEAQAAGVPCVLYKGFPKSVDMNLNLATFMDTFDTMEWVDEILKMKDKKVEDKDFIHHQISSLGFDTVENTLKIEKLYRDA